MLQNCALFLAVILSFSCTSNVSTNAIHNEISNWTTSTTTFIPTTASHLIEDATCRRAENHSMTDEEGHNNTPFHEQQKIKDSTTQQVNGTTGFNLETTNRTAQLNLNEFNDTDCLKNTTKRENVLEEDLRKISNKNRCPSFKNGVEVTLAQLLGDWRTVFYKATQVITCFKIYIRKISFEEKLRHKERYGTFNRSVDWHNCHLEVISNRIKGRHFLQGGLGDEGVLRNIIIVKAKNGCHKLKEEAPGQWRAFNHLLLLRACDNGDVIVFTRFGKIPSQDDVKEAVEAFGETKFHGIPTCQDTMSPNENDTRTGDILKADLDYSHDEESRNTVPIYDLI